MADTTTLTCMIRGVADLVQRRRLVEHVTAKIGTPDQELFDLTGMRLTYYDILVGEAERLAATLDVVMTGEARDAEDSKIVLPPLAYKVWEDPRGERHGTVVCSVPGLGKAICNCDTDGEPQVGFGRLRELFEAYRTDLDPHAEIADVLQMDVFAGFASRASDGTGQST